MSSPVRLLDPTAEVERTVLSFYLARQLRVVLSGCFGWGITCAVEEFLPSSCSHLAGLWTTARWSKSSDWRRLEVHQLQWSCSIALIGASPITSIGNCGVRGGERSSSRRPLPQCADRRRRLLINLMRRRVLEVLR